MVGIRDFRDLKVWQKSHKFVLGIYAVTKDFPPEERFGLVSQMRRAAVSIPANIAEGFRKRGKRDKANFYNIAQGSLDEIIYYLILSKDLEYLKSNKNLLADAEETHRMLHGLIDSLK
ncbi:MAG: four helix bundle protein [bacterium]